MRITDDLQQYTAQVKELSAHFYRSLLRAIVEVGGFQVYRVAGLYHYRKIGMSPEDAEKYTNIRTATMLSNLEDIDMEFVDLIIVNKEWDVLNEYVKELCAVSALSEELAAIMAPVAELQYVYKDKPTNETVDKVLETLAQALDVKIQELFSTATTVDA